MMEKNGIGKTFDKRDLHDAAKFAAALEDLMTDKQ